MYYGKFKTLVKAALWAEQVLSGHKSAESEDFDLAWRIQADIESDTKPAVVLVKPLRGLPDYAFKNHVS